MSTFIPSTNVGRNNRREHFNLGQDTHTTAEIGYIQPTYCRYIIPGSTSKISSRNLVRLSPLAVPTMGRISLRNYFYFVDLSTLWTPFDSMRNQLNYTYGDGSVSIPLCVPTFRLVDFFTDICKPGAPGNRSTFITDIRESIVCSVYKNGTLLTSGIDAALTSGLSFLPWIPYIICSGSGVNYTRYKSAQTASSVTYTASSLSFSPVTNQSADFSFSWLDNTDKLQILGKFTGASKRLRTVFIGCGYSFNPYDDSRQTLLKLLAVYKSWFDTFAVQRTLNFNNTMCYQVIKYLSETPPSTTSFDSNAGTYYCNVYDSTYFNSSLDEKLSTFIGQLADICYNLPPDYFSASDITAQRGAWTNNGSLNLSISSPTMSTNTPAGEKFVGAKSSYGQTSLTTDGNAQPHVNIAGSFALANQLAEKLLRYVNKRSVVGRKIADLLKLNNEKDLHNNEHESVHHLGVDRVEINISDVTSLASTSDASLGDFAGRGLGMGQTDTYVYDNSNYGILLCLTCVVPTSGYFQGILRENSDSNMFEFFTDMYDAQGYQTVRMNELVADMQFKTSSGGNTVGTNIGNFGLAPRYQHIKVGRNICNGDISIPSMQDVMLPYSLDRHFITKKTVGSINEFGDVLLPSNTPEAFRQIRANDAYGDYNRIFQYVGSDYDHFILQMVFNVDVMSPMKSIANSYDTFDEDDNGKLEFEHQ